MRQVFSPLVKETDRPYSQCVQTDVTVLISGQVPVDPNGAVVGVGDARKQTNQVVRNIESLVSAAGGTLTNIVKLTVFLSDMAHYEAMNDVLAAEFREPPLPTRSTICAGLVNPDFLVEIEAIAIVPRV